MDKDKFLKNLAEYGYNVLFGAKKHYATYDIVEKLPGWIAFITLCIGIWQIYDPAYVYNREISLVIIFVSIAALLINNYATEKDTYKDVGNILIEIHNDLKKIYYQVQSSNTSTVDQSHELKLQELLKKYYDLSISKQVFLSDWYAHYKFFFQSQYEWINEQKKFTWRDKIPLSLRIVFSLLLLSIVAIAILIIF